MDSRAAIRQLQEELHMKQTDLAYALGVSKVTVNRWMQGKSAPSRAMILSIISYARSHGASEGCRAGLESALFPESEPAGIDDLRFARIDQINRLANESSNAIFVCDKDTRDLMYVNRQLSRFTGKPVSEAEGKKCYEYLFRRDTPCVDCPMNGMSEDQFTTREFISPVTGKRYMSRSKQITWNNRPAHIDYITDVTALQVGNASDETQAVTAPAVAARRGKHTILVVDDQNINRRILHRLLQGEYAVMEAENGQQALDMLRENSNTISAVLLDIVMPVLDGYGVLEAMRDDPALSKIPVIVSSQKDGDEAEIRALSLGAQDFIAKPYKGDIIRHRLENTIRLRETAAIANRAERDELTGLLSKQFFVERVTDTLHLNPENQYDIRCFDIERFKLVNDTYGEKTGDELLRYAGGVLDNMPGTLLASRFSADHFYQLVSRDSEKDEECVREFLEKLHGFPIELNLNVNCGIYKIKDNTAAVMGMCDRAKLAADSNHNRADKSFSYYDDSLRQQLVEEQFILGAMKAGLEERQFKVYYQPKYDLHTEMLAGAEALVRWIHPEKGFMSPGAFIPIFEKNGFITQLDRYVWEQACMDIRSWIDKGMSPVPVSVNVSRADVFNPHLIEILTGLVKKYNIPIPYLHLEITESAYTNNPEQIIAVVSKLHDLGFVIEMDDFGSGYSSLNMLAELPVDILKLDMRFVQNETTHTSGRGIISFVISLAKWMKLSVIAEGVETAEQIESLRSMDCNYVQGFYYAKPMPENDFEVTLRTVAVASIVAAEEEAAPIAVAPASDRVMLVVDDIEVNRAVLTSVFAGEYTVVEKADGREALEYLQKHADRVEVILLDLLMPVMDGFQLLEIIRHDERMAEIPVIVTSQGDVNAEERALGMGAADFISKPYSPPIVRHRVHNIVQIHRLQDAQRQELDETRTREQTLMGSIPGGVALYHLRRDGKITTEYVSEGLAHLCGYTREEFMNSVREDARLQIVPEDIPRLMASVESSLKNHTLIHELQHIYTKNGTSIPVRFDASVQPETTEDGEGLAVLYAVHTRVSDDADSVLHEQYRYRYVLDNLDVAYFELDENGDVYVSDKYSLYAVSDLPGAGLLDENAGEACYACVHKEDLPILFDFMDQRKRGLPKISATLRLKMQDGSYRWTELMAFIEYDTVGEREKIIGLLRDVDTEWQNQNRKLQEALSSAEQANRAKTDFLARVSHEIRTPLNGILGLTELMANRRSGETFTKDIEELKQSGLYLLDLINDTLDVSTIEQGKMQLHPIVCDGKTVFQNVISMVRPSMDAKNIKFHLQAENLPFTRLYIDAGRVEQAVINVLSNAVKFTPEGGDVYVTMENVSHDNNVITDRIVVRDTGIGMSKEFAEHLFEPFAQEHNDNHSVHKGTGLGMTITYQCVHLMGGTISVESEEGKGTTVTILLPMPVATREQIAAWNEVREETSLRILKGKRVLLCEDHPLNARIAIRLLKKKGMQVDHAENGKRGVELFAASPRGTYDAVLMDIRMPVMDGLEATRNIRGLPRPDAKRVPIIAMTANTMKADVQVALNAGMTEHLGKPVEPTLLYHTLADLIGRPNPMAGKKVLVVDDVEMNRGMVRKAIDNVYNVLEAASGTQALEMLQQDPEIAAVVTDIQMPGMDGKELIRRIRADHTMDEVAILANTIYGDHRQEEELLALGANDFVYKPASPQVLMMRLERILRNMQ